MEVQVHSVAYVLDFDRKLLVECYDWNKSGSDELIGGFEV